MWRPASCALEFLEPGPGSHGLGAEPGIHLGQEPVGGGGGEDLGQEQVEQFPLDPLRRRPTHRGMCRPFSSSETCPRISAGYAGGGAVTAMYRVGTFPRFSAMWTSPAAM